MKNWIKLVILTILIVVLLIPSPKIMAKNTNETDVETKANHFLEIIDVNEKVNSPIFLKNLDNQLNYIAYSIGDSGYIIINLNNLIITELSLDNPNPFIDINNPIYNGPLNYYSFSKNGLVSLKDNKLISKEDIKPTTYTTNNNLRVNKALPKGNVNTIKTISGTLKKWYVDGGSCGSIASAICMRYYYDYVSKSYVNPKQISESSLINLMKKYVGAYGTNYPQVVTGLNTYFKDKRINHTARTINGFDFSKLIERTQRNRPIIIGTKNDNKYGNHWLIGHGYAITNDSSETTKYAIVNDGWRHNNIWVNIKTASLDGIIYFYR